MTTERSLAKDDEVINSIIEVAEKIGSIKAFELLGQTSKIAKVQFLYRVHNLFKSEKRHAIKQYFPNFQSVCEKFNINYSAAMEEIQNIDALGEKFVVAAKQIGIGRDVFRDVRKLPEHERDEVRQVLENTGTADADMIKNVIESLVEEKQELEGRVAERDRNLDRAQEQAVKLEAERAKLEDRIAEIEPKTMPRDDAEFEKAIGGLMDKAYEIKTSMQRLMTRYDEEPDKQQRVAAAGIFVENNIRKILSDFELTHLGETWVGAYERDIENKIEGASDMAMNIQSPRNPLNPGNGE